MEGPGAEHPNVDGAGLAAKIGRSPSLRVTKEVDHETDEVVQGID